MARRKKTEETPGEAPQAEERRVLPDHNQGLSQATLLRHMAAIRTLTTQKDEIVGKIRNAKKQAKDDGVDLKTLDRVMREQEVEPEVLIEEHNRLVSYRRFLALPIGAQMSFLDAEKGELTPERIKEQARSDGEQAGLRGASTTDSPHDPNSDAGRAWLDGYDAGQETLRSAMQAKMEKVAA